MKSNIGDKLKMLRKAKGLTQQEVADAVDMSRATLGGYEIGRRQPRLTDLQRIADFYGVGLDYFGIASTDDVFDLLARAKDVFASDEISKEDKDDLYKELMRLYLKLSK